MQYKAEYLKKLAIKKGAVQIVPPVLFLKLNPVHQYFHHSSLSCLHPLNTGKPA